MFGVKASGIDARANCPIARRREGHFGIVLWEIMHCTAEPPLPHSMQRPGIVSELMSFVKAPFVTISYSKCINIIFFFCV